MGVFFSQRILLALVQAGVSREKAYRLVQRNAFQVQQKARETFLEALSADIEVTSYVSVTELQNLFDFRYYTEHVDLIFQRVFDRMSESETHSD